MPEMLRTYTGKPQNGATVCSMQCVALYKGWW